MPPFLQFRLWLKESPIGERASAAAAAAVAIVLIVIALVPVATRHGDAATALDSSLRRPTAGVTAPDGSIVPGEAALAPDGSSASAPSSAGTRTTANATTGNPQIGDTADPCRELSASAPGISAKEVFIVVSLISLAGPIGNSQFGIRPDLHEIVNALVDETNKTGGLACARKLRAKIYDVNPLDTNDAQAKCLDMVADKPYLVMDFGGYLGQATRACFVQNKLPIISSVAFDAAEFKSAFPYVVSPRDLAESQASNTAFGLADRGFFKAPAFKKLGLIVENCLPAVEKALDNDLAKVGLKSSQISKYELNCNPASANNQIAQAVLQHKADGATHVLLATANNNAQNYVKIAAAQAFRPRYGLGDLGEGVTPSGAKNWDASFDGALGITTTHTGETSSGMRNALVDKCDQVMKRHGVKGFTSEGTDLALLGLCDLFDFLRAAINKAGANPVRTSFATGITQMGEFKTAYAGDGVFNRPDKYHGSDFQRAIQYHSDCGCWKVKDAFAAAYPA